MRTGVLVLVLVLTAVVSGCGSSGNGWQVVTRVSADGTSPGFIDNAAVARPAQLEVSVDAKPGIAVRTTYAFICGDVTTDGSATRSTGLAQTPATVTLRPPAGPPNECRVNVLVNKSGPSSMTVTLRMRPLPSTPKA